MMNEAKKLREQTGASIIDCRAALAIAKDDPVKAASFIRAQGTIHGFPHSLSTEARLRSLGW